MFPALLRDEMCKIFAYKSFGFVHAAVEIYPRDERFEQAGYRLCPGFCTAAEEQTTATSEISANMQKISSDTEEIVQSAEQAIGHCDNSVDSIRNLVQNLSRFKLSHFQHSHLDHAFGNTTPAKK